MGVNFDGNISIGNVLEVACFIGVWVITIVKIDGRLKTVESNQEKHDAKLDSLNAITNMQARFDERIGAIRRDMDDLKRGKGYIHDELDGEYLHKGKIKNG